MDRTKSHTLSDILFITRCAVVCGADGWTEAALFGHSAENFSRIRRLALNLLRRDKTCKAGVKGKRLQACLKEEYLLRVISPGVQMRLPWFCT